MCVRIKWPRVVPFRIIDQPLLTWIYLGNGTIFKICAFFEITQNLSNLKLFVAIESIGAAIFIYPGGEINFKYVSVKLNLHDEGDARIIADWINAQFNIYGEQQGEYNEKDIQNIESYVLIGESLAIPLYPIILEEKDD